MKKNTPIIIVLALLLVGGGLVASRSLSKKSPNQSKTDDWTERLETEKEEEQGFAGKMKDALSLGKSMKCTWKHDDGNFGTAHIKNEKVYTEVTSNGQKMFSIYANDCSYVWDNEKKQGMKVCVDPEEMEAEDTKAEKTDMPDPFAWETPDIEYSCQNEVISDSLFTPPTDIEFTISLEMLQNMDLPEGFELPEGM